MMKVTTKINFSPEGVGKRIAQRVQRAQFDLDQQVAKDSNYFAPEDTGSLKRSVLPSAAEGKGVLEWNEPYARKQYYEAPNKSKDKNPSATMKWFERAKAEFKARWEKVAKRGYSK